MFFCDWPTLGDRWSFINFPNYLQLTSCTLWEFIIFWKPRIFQNFWGMSFKNHWLTSYKNIYSNISFPKAVNKTCPCGVTIFTSHHKVIASSSLLQGYYIKVYQGYYVTVTLTNHRPFQNRPTLDAKNAFLLIGDRGSAMPMKMGGRGPGGSESRIFVRGNPYQKPKTQRIWPTIFLKMGGIIPRSLKMGGTRPPRPPPVAEPLIGESWE